MRSLCLIIALLYLGAPSAADLAREQRIGEQISEGLLVGEPVTLEAKGVSFLALYTLEESAYTQGAVVVLHGQGANPDWMDVVSPLRSQLPEYGWQSLSLQMPVAASDAEPWVYQSLIPEAIPRIAAAVDYLRQQGVNNIVLIGHSLGARMGLAYLAQGVPEEVKAFVAVGLPIQQSTQLDAALQALETLQIPILDLFGSRDIEPVVDSVKQRRQAAQKAGNRRYRQTEVQGADHFFRGLDDALVAQVKSWLGRVAPGKRVDTDVRPKATN